MNVMEDGKKTVCDLENVHVCNIGISCLNGEELLRQVAFHQEYKRSQKETNVRHIIQLSDLDKDDTALGKLLTEAHRENANFQKECLSVRRHCLSRSIERGNPWEKAMSISLVLVSGETRTQLTASFL